MKSKICGAQIHTDYGPSYPEAYDHPAFIFYRALKKNMKAHIFVLSKWIRRVGNDIHESEYNDLKMALPKNIPWGSFW